MPKRLDPKLDIVFKLLFGSPGSEEILISLLTAIIRPPAPIKSVTVLNPETPRELPADRGVTLDLQVELADGRQVDIEMQISGHPGMRKRMIYHWSRMYEGQLQRGMEYEELEPCVCIFILDYNELPSSRFHSKFMVLEVHDHDPLSDQLEIHLARTGGASSGSRTTTVSCRS